MRASDLLPPLLSERHSLRRRRQHPAVTHATEATIVARDPAVERVRSAGGPIDNACYSCSCGLVFAAAVSTTVACPRCGASQAW
jgi:hypothetical protein